MLKQKRDSKLKYRQYKRRKKTFRYRKFFRNSISSVLNPSLLLFTNKNQIDCSVKINIKVTQNNVFCSLIGIKNNKILLTTSSGKEKMLTSRKTLRFSSRYILLSFFKKIKSFTVKPQNLFIKVTAPLRIKILIIRLLKKKFLYKKNVIFTFAHKKCFNGCKPPKKKRKKRKGLRVFK